MQSFRSKILASSLVVTAVTAAIASMGGCGSSSTPPKLDAGHEGHSDAPVGKGCTTPAAVKAADGFSLTPSACVDETALQPGQLLLTASGEILALDGYNFPVDPNGKFADGWEVIFKHYIATFDKVSLWDSPDTSPTDQSQVGNLVAELDGPWAVDMHLNGPSFPYIDGKEQGERAVAFAVLDNQNKNGNMPLPTDGTRLAVGFSAVTATPKALSVNLDADGMANYEYMVKNGCTVLYVGTATWKGDQSPGLCATPSASGDAGATCTGSELGRGTEPAFASIPKVVNFDLCFKPRGTRTPGEPETSWINCDNSDNDPAPGLNGEPHERGIAFKANTYTVGEVTFHTDHPFWESTKHDTPARFDQFAAQAVGMTGTPTVHFTDVMGVNFEAMTDKKGKPLSWRTCDPDYMPSNSLSRCGQMRFDPVHVPLCKGGNSGTGLCDYYDFSKYNQSTQGHWNGADGLCFVQRHYPSPP